MQASPEKPGQQDRFSSSCRTRVSPWQLLLSTALGFEFDCQALPAPHCSVVPQVLHSSSLHVRIICVFSILSSFEISTDFSKRHFSLVGRRSGPSICPLNYRYQCLIVGAKIQIVNPFILVLSPPLVFDSGDATLSSRMIREGKEYCRPCGGQFGGNCALFRGLVAWCCSWRSGSALSPMPSPSVSRHSFESKGKASQGIEPALGTPSPSKSNSS